MSRTISIKSLFKEYWKLWLGFGLYGFGIGIGSKHTIISIIFVIVGILSYMNLKTTMKIEDNAKM